MATVQRQLIYSIQGKRSPLKLGVHAEFLNLFWELAAKIHDVVGTPKV